MEKLTRKDDMVALAISKRIMCINKLGGKCIKCGFDNFIALDFHHKELYGKLDTINNLKGGRLSVVNEEILKCEILCSNCHQESHYNGDRNAVAKRNLMLNYGFYECSKCKYSGDNFSSLSFHHVDPSTKKFIINHVTTRRIHVSIQELNDELKKCIVLCGNCHRIEHFDIERYNRLRTYIDYKMRHYKEIQPKLDRVKIWDMYVNQNMKQIEIANYFNAAKSTISGAIKNYAMENNLDLPLRKKKITKVNKYKSKHKPKSIRPKTKLIKEKKVYSRVCPYCNNKFETYRMKKKYCSMKCSRLVTRKVEHPSKEELMKMRETMSYAEIGKKYGVSRIAVYRWVNPLSK